SAGRSVVPVAPRNAVKALGWLLHGPWEQLDPVRVAGRPGGLPYQYIGIAVCLLLWARRAWRRIPAVRAPSDYESAIFARAADGASAELRIVASGLAPGALGVWRPKVLLPDRLATELSEAELEAVLAHEIAHVRRHDNLLAVLAHAVVTAFWF